MLDFVLMVIGHADDSKVDKTFGRKGEMTMMITMDEDDHCSASTHLVTNLCPEPPVITIVSLSGIPQEPLPLCFRVNILQPEMITSFSTGEPCILHEILWFRIRSSPLQCIDLRPVNRFRITMGKWGCTWNPTSTACISKKKRDFHDFFISNIFPRGLIALLTKVGKQDFDPFFGPLGHIISLSLFVTSLKPKERKSSFFTNFRFTSVKNFPACCALNSEATDLPLS